MRNKIYFIALLSLALFGCIDEEIVRVKSGVAVSGSLQQSTSRTAYTVGDNSVSVSWEVGDAIGIMSASQTAPLKYTATTSASVTDFEAAGSEVNNDESETFYAWYPYTGTYDDSYPLAVLPHIYSQKYNEGKFSSSYDFVYGSGQIVDDQLNFSFSHLFTYVKIIIDPSVIEDAYGFVLVGSENISVRYTTSTYNFETGEISGNLSRYVFYQIDRKYIEQGEPLTCYIAMLPSSENNSISIQKRIYTGSGYTNGDQIYVKDAPDGGFKAGRMYTLYIGEGSYEELMAEEREALIALYNATGGDNWTNNENWCTDADVSEWYGVEVSNGFVRSLSLNDNNLDGYIPSEIGDLSQMLYLYLNSNNLTGEIPDEICELKHLYYLYLCDNNISGEIPSGIGKLTNLYGLDLSRNNLSGEIPDEMWNLLSLVTLNLYRNNLSGSIHESIGNLTPLKRLNLFSNQLSGSIPTSLYNLTSLNYLSLYDNELSGEIPEDIGNLTSLTILNLSGNELSGEIPTSLGNLTALTELNLSDNDLTGNLPTSMAALNALESIDVTENKLKGEVPEEILNCEWWSNLGYSGILAQQNGYGLTLPYSLHDWTVHTLQEHTKGLGIKIVIMGEAFTQELIDDGTYKKKVDWAFDALFTEEPYASFQEYFDVYYVDIPSEEAVLGGNTAFQVSYDSETSKLVKDRSIPIDFLGRLEETNYKYADVTSIIIINSELSLRSNTSWSMSTGFSAAYCMCRNEENFKAVVHHEALGHGFSKLADEYIEYEGTYPNAESLVNYHENGCYLNVDTNSDPDEILWSYFLSDSRYVDYEGIGIYEGAHLYPYGVYRSRNNSIMRNNTDGFNAPSRLQIYKHIMELSGERYSFENFLEYDEINLESFSSGSSSRSYKKAFNGLLGSTPEIIE